MQRRLGTCCARIGWCRDLSTFAFSRAVRRRRSVARTCCTTRTIAALQLLLVHHRLVGMLIPLALACPPRDFVRAAELEFASTSNMFDGFEERWISTNWAKTLVLTLVPVHR
jgi:hypothetical protein